MKSSRFDERPAHDERLDVSYPHWVIRRVARRAEQAGVSKRAIIRRIVTDAVRGDSEATE